MKKIWKVYKHEIIIALVGFAVLHLIFLFTFRGNHIEPESAGLFGDFTAGYFGTIFSLVGIVLLVRTLKNERLSSEREHFETKYFELIKMHRDNVEELQLGKATGRKVFVLMIRELRCALTIIKAIDRYIGRKHSDTQLLKVAYYCLFFGVGPNSSRMLIESLSDLDPQFVTAVESRLNDPKVKQRVKRQRKFGYIPFEGHQSRLGHYYRHLYHLIRYVADETLDINKQSHMKTVRAQLSTHEQALLLVNSLTPIGRRWWSNGYLIDYKLVKNIPRNFFKHSELDMRTQFPPLYFEWEEIIP